MTTKLKLNTTNNKISLTDGTNYKLKDLKFDLSQFKIPNKFLTLFNQISVKEVKEKNNLGEYVGIGVYNITFKVYDRNLVELALNNNLADYGSPITITVENTLDLPDLSKFEEDEFIPINFTSISIYPKNTKRSIREGNKLIDLWIPTSLKMVAENYKFEG